MNSILAKLKSRDFLVVILFLQLTLYATVFFDVPVARQVIGFICLSLVPGFIMIKLLKLDELDGLETLLFSVGLSVAFLMLAGLSINEFCLLFGVSNPLSLMPLMMILNSLVLLGGILVYLRSEDIKSFAAETLSLSPLALLFIGFPVLSVVGALFANASGNSSILLFMILAIAVLLVLGILSKRFVPPKLYPFIILMIAITLLFHSSLISNYICGNDINLEYYTFRLTHENEYWNSTAYSTEQAYGRFNSMLGITILPTVYSNMLSMDETWILKIIYPLIFSLVPLSLYKTWQMNVNKKIAFISAFLFMSQLTFYTELLGLARQMVAELFFVLLFTVILCKKLDSISSKVCFIVFSVALITSHYALSIIFLFLISIAWIFTSLRKKKLKNLTLGLIIFFFVIMFFWYIYTSGSTSFESLLYFGDRVYNSLSDFFDPASRGTQVMRGLGMEGVESQWQAVSRGFAYATEFFIIVGFIALLVKWKKQNFDWEFAVFSSLGIVLLAMCVVVPGLASTLNMTRFYHIILFFVSPLFALGCKALIDLLGKRKKQIYVSFLTVMVLVPYFLFQTNFVYEVTKSEAWSVSLSKNRIDKISLYSSIGFLEEQGVLGACWLSQNVGKKQNQIYADFPSQYKVLTGYGGVNRGDVRVLSNTSKIVNGVVYLSPLNVIHGKIVSRTSVWNYTELSSIVDNLNKVYTNGGSEVYVAAVDSP